MKPNEMNSATSGMTPAQKANWMAANHAALLEMARLMQDPGTIENQQADNLAKNHEIKWCLSNPDPDIKPGELRFRRKQVPGAKNRESIPLVVINVHKTGEGLRFYEVLQEGRLVSYGAETFELLPDSQHHR